MVAFPQQPLSWPPLRVLVGALLLCVAPLAQALTVRLEGVAAGSEAFVAALERELDDDSRVVMSGEADLVVVLHKGALPRARTLVRPRLLLLPNADSAALQADESAIYWAPSLRDQLRLARHILPGLQRVGVLAGPASLDEARALRDALPAGIELLVRVAEPGHLTRQIAEVAAASDVLLAPVEPDLFNRDNLRPILLAAYRQQRALIGPSPAYVRAGALASLFASPETLAADVARAIAFYRRERRWPTPSLVSRFDVITNPQVARALGIPLPDTPALTRAMLSEKVVVWP